MRQPRIALMRPLLPTAQTLLPYLQRIDETRWYSNAGPLAQAFGARLAETFGVPDTTVALAANGTLALQLAARTTALARRTKCLMPAWTFAATPLAAMQAGLVPHFADIDPATWSLPPDAVPARNDLDEIALILPVAPYGAAPDLDAWARVTAQTGIPVVIDAAAGFDALAHNHKAAKAAMPVMMSLHATKPLGIGEGGLVLAADDARARDISRYANFGFDCAGQTRAPGTNAKLSEYHAAVGLAALDAWPQRRDALLAAQTHYAQQLCEIDGISPMPGMTAKTASSTINVVCSRPASSVIASLAQHGIEARQWWAGGCHTHPAFAHLPKDPLPHTDKLAPHVVGLPLSPDMPLTDIGQVCAALRALA